MRDRVFCFFLYAATATILRVGQAHREQVSETEIIVGDYASVGSSNSAGMKVQLLSRSATAERGNSLYL